MIYIICHKTDHLEYILNGVDITNISIINLNDECSAIQKVFRRVLPLFFAHPIFILGRRLRRIIIKLGNRDSLLIFGYTNKNLISAIFRLASVNVAKYVWLWNPIKGNEKSKTRVLVEFIKKNGFEICTFDGNDATNFDLTYLSQFYRMFPKMHSENEIVYDFYFLGNAKDRFEKIDILKSSLSKYRTLFQIVRSESERISYERNIEFVKSSRCIIDLVQKNQKGISLRPLEALAYNKKLLTNNVDIKNYEFYDPKNIFILGENDFCEMDNFLNSDSYTFEESLKIRYDVNNWIRYFIK